MATIYECLAPKIEALMRAELAEYPAIAYDVAEDFSETELKNYILTYVNYLHK